MLLPRFVSYLLRVGFGLIALLPAPALAEAPSPAPTAPRPADTSRLPPNYIVDPVLGPLRRGVDVDVDLSLALGTLRGADHGSARLLRARFGTLISDEPWFPAIGVTAELSSYMPAMIGVEAEILSTAAASWAQLGVSADLHSRYGASFAFGWETFGFEVDLRRLPDGDYVWGYFVKLRFLLGHLLAGLEDEAARMALRKH